MQSVIAFTHADSVEEFTDALAARIASLGRTQTLLAESNWEHVELGEAILAQFTPILDIGEEARVSVSGPLVFLKAKPAEALLMALHELATNAIKYGALSVEKGRVLLNWSRHRDGSLSITWKEEGGPALSEAPERTGFGLELIDTLFGAKGQATFSWVSTGLMIEIHMGTDELARPIPANSQSRNLVASGPVADAMDQDLALHKEVHVLVVEDEAMIARLMTRRLKMAGCNVIGPAFTISHALSLIDAEPKPDAAIVDWNLAGEAATSIFEALEAANIPFCLATGNASIGVENGFELVLEKPFSADNFKLVLSALLDKAHQTRDTSA